MQKIPDWSKKEATLSMIPNIYTYILELFVNQRMKDEKSIQSAGYNETGTFLFTSDLNNNLRETEEYV